MPWLPIYASETDFAAIFTLLNEDEETAFLVADGAGLWIAKKSQAYAGDARYCIWHTHSGPLPLLRHRGSPDDIVADPWTGWKEIRQGADQSTPYFGPGHPGIIWLNAHAHSKRKKDSLGLSSFEWIGNYYRAIGSPAPEATEKYWQRLRRMIKKGAVRIPREGSWDGAHPEIWALPDALSKIKQGYQRDDNPSI